MACPLAKGKIFFRDIGAQALGHRQFILAGHIWVPEESSLKSENAYVIVGSEHNNEGLPCLGFQVLLNSGEDLTGETKKKHPSQIIALLHTAKP